VTNPLLADWQTPFALPPFEAIHPDHFPPAFVAAFDAQTVAVRAIIECQEEPGFANTMAALELSGALLRRVSGVFFNLASADTSAELQAIERDIGPRLAAHRGAIWTNPALFTRVRALQAGAAQLADDERQLLSEMLTRFRRAGAELDADKLAEVLRLDEELAILSTRFEQNVRQDANSFELVLESAEELAGLPEFVLATARAEAQRRGHSGKCVFTISRSSITPFLQYSANRSLRQTLYTAYVNCGRNGNAFDNREVIHELVALRLRRARLLGYACHADYMLDDRMAGSSAAVRALLDKVRAPAFAQLAREANDLRELAAGELDELQPWDWWYYTEKLRALRFAMDPAQIKAFFPIEQVRDGAFAVAEKLYGISFRAVADFPTYHEDIDAFEVLDQDGSHLGLFLTDYYQRPSKATGAWMSEFRGASNIGEMVRPLVINCCNFSKGEPTLLDMDEVRTLFHELGHGLHGLLTQARFPSLAGTSVKQDFVELPSQIMEHWAREPEVLRSYARHFETGDPIPDTLIEKLHASESFNTGFATSEYLAACYLDLAWHELKDSFTGDVEAFETRAMADISLPPQIAPRYRSTYFRHIFDGESYSAGYYVYIWAEVLDADAYEAFRERGIFDRSTATAFRRHILEPGGSADPMSLYTAFRGRPPEEDALLNNRGLRVA